MTLNGQASFITGNSNSIQQALNQIKNYNSDIVLALGLYADAVTVVNVSIQIGLQPKAFFLTSAPGTPEFVTQLGSTVNYLIGPVQWHQDLNDSDHSDLLFGAASDYATKFLARFGVDSDQNSAEATAAAYVYQRAIELAQDINQEDILTQLTKYNENTFYGQIQFAADGSNSAKPMYTVQILDGFSYLVTPDSHAEHAFVYPIPYPSTTTGVVQTTLSLNQTTTSPLVTTASLVTTGDLLPVNASFNTCFNDTLLGLKFEICWILNFFNCQADSMITLDGQSVFHQVETVSQVSAIFVNDTCQSVLGVCTFCSQWTSLVLNTTTFNGCRRGSLTCDIFGEFDFDLGCFSNDALIPLCFGSCQDHCNLKGVCENGACQCVAPYSGLTCSQSSTNCPNNCGDSIRGSCVNGVCECQPGFGGADCSEYLGLFFFIFFLDKFINQNRSNCIFFKIF